MTTSTAYAHNLIEWDRDFVILYSLQGAKDFCKACKKAGFEVAYVPEVVKNWYSGEKNTYYRLWVSEEFLKAKEVNFSLNSFSSRDRDLAKRIAEVKADTTLSAYMKRKQIKRFTDHCANLQKYVDTHTYTELPNYQDFQR